MSGPPRAPHHRPPSDERRGSGRDRWVARWLALRRGVLLRRRLLAALCVGIAGFAALHTLAPPPPDAVEVAVAARDLPAGTVIASSHLEQRRVAPDQRPAGLLDAAELTGRTLGAPVRAGEMVTDARTVAPRLLTGYPGAVAVPVRIPDAASVALLSVGDRIDVTAVDPHGGSGGDTVATDVPVLAIPAETGHGPAPGLGGRLVVLAVSRSKAQDLVGASVNRHLSFVLSGPGGPHDPEGE